MYFNVKMCALGCNPDLFRRVALCRIKCDRGTHVSSEAKAFLDGSCHLLDMMCLHAYHNSLSIPNNLFSLVLRLAPRSARLDNGKGRYALHYAVGRGGAPLKVVTEIIMVADNLSSWETNILLLAQVMSKNIFGLACDWTLGGGIDFDKRLKMILFLLEYGGTSKRILFHRRKGPYPHLPINELISMMRYLEENGLLQESQKDKCKALIMKTALMMYEAHKGTKAPSDLFATIWSAQYMSRWKIPKFGEDKDNKISIDDVLLYDFIFDVTGTEEKIEGLNISMLTPDERGNNVFHVAAGLSCRLAYNRHKLCHYSWNNYLAMLVVQDEDGASQRNVFGRLPIHIALSVGTWYALGPWCPRFVSCVSTRP